MNRSVQWVMALAITVTNNLIFAQGVQFEQSVSLQQVMAKANAENKFVLIDCYATWCKPCKEMDKNVYSLDSVGSFINDKYVAVKVQFDSTRADNEQIKQWYADAHYMEKQYNVTSYPTFLFFSPDGKLVHRSVGYKDPGRFLGITRRTLDPQHQYYTLLENYRQGKMPFNQMVYLTDLARSVDDNGIAKEVSENYIDNYLLKLDASDLYTQKNLQFIADFLKRSTDKSFQLFYRHGDEIDVALQKPGFSRNKVDQIIEQEEINKVLYANEQALKENKIIPDWPALYKRVKNKYTATDADRIILWAKIQWLEWKQDWPQYCKLVVTKIEKYGPYNKYNPYGTDSKEELLNYSAWEIFRRSTDIIQLKKALNLSEKSMDIHPGSFPSQYLDTYANILYKLGRVAEAIKMDEKAISMESAEVLTKEYSNNLIKIRNGKPTWPTK